MDWEQLPGRTRVMSCDLCEEARITEWFHEDEDCWIAECEICSVPMVVWRNHDHRPPDEVKAVLHEQLAMIVDAHFEFRDGFYVDDHMRNIPDHYHAHARPQGGFFGHHLRKNWITP